MIEGQARTVSLSMAHFQPISIVSGCVCDASRCHGHISGKACGCTCSLQRMVLAQMIDFARQRSISRRLSHHHSNHLETDSTPSFGHTFLKSSIESPS